MELRHSVARAAFIKDPVGGDEYIHVFGEIDIETQESFREAIVSAARSAKRIVVDLTRCTYIGSQGFTVLVHAQKLTDIAVIAPARIRRLMDVVGLANLLSEA